MIGPSSTIYKEEQKFQEPWIWIILIASGLVSFGALLATSFTEQRTPLNLFWGFGIVGAIQFVLLWAFYKTRFDIMVDPAGVHYRWRPFQKRFRTIHVRDIAEYSVRNAPFLKRGYSWVLTYGRAHNVSGGKGIQFVLTSSKKIFLGTQRVSAFKDAIEKIIQSSDLKTKTVSRER
jgi:hypothetical protein